MTNKKETTVKYDHFVTKSDDWRYESQDEDPEVNMSAMSPKEQEKIRMTVAQTPPKLMEDKIKTKAVHNAL